MNGCCFRFLGGRTESGLETSSDEASALATIEKKRVSGTPTTVRS